MKRFLLSQIGLNAIARLEGGRDQLIDYRKEAERQRDTLQADTDKAVAQFNDFIAKVDNALSEIAL